MSWTELPINFFCFLVSAKSPKTLDPGGYLTGQINCIWEFCLLLPSWNTFFSWWLCSHFPGFTLTSFGIPPQFLPLPCSRLPPPRPVSLYSLSLRVIALVPAIYWALDLFLALNFTLFRVNEAIYGSKLFYCRVQTPRHCKLRVKSISWSEPQEI